MSYNNIGLSTARGSGTSGYIQRNLATNRFYNNNRGNVNYNNVNHRDFSNILKQKANKDILLHKKKRQIDLQVLLYREQLEEDGVDNIDEKVAAKRKELKEKFEKGELEFHNKLDDTHQITAAKQQQLDVLRNELRIKETYEEGHFLDVMYQKDDEELDEEKLLEKPKRYLDRQRDGAVKDRDFYKKRMNERYDRRRSKRSRHSRSRSRERYSRNRYHRSRSPDYNRRRRRRHSSRSRSRHRRDRDRKSRSKRSRSRSRSSRRRHRRKRSKTSDIKEPENGEIVESKKSDANDKKSDANDKKSDANDKNATADKNIETSSRKTDDEKTNTKKRQSRNRSSSSSSSSSSHS